MKLLRPVSFILPVVVAAILLSHAGVARADGYIVDLTGLGSVDGVDHAPVTFPIHEGRGPRIKIVQTPSDGGILENVPAKYRARFEKWKAEFVSTKFGKDLWETYANNKEFVLRIVISRERKHGAGTDDFEWDETGRLVGATITLGSDLDDGFPSPIYYPVLNSLTSYVDSTGYAGRVLAAAKISHEFGHVRQIGNESMSLLETQSRLIPVYVSIFRENGLNMNDPRLLSIEEQIGGTPVGSWESREYSSEVNAMLYLNERIGSEPRFCSVFNRIRQNLQTYAPRYEPRFEKHTDFAACGSGNRERSEGNPDTQAQ